MYNPLKVIIAKLFAGNEAHLLFHLYNFVDTQSLVSAVRRIPYCDGNTNTTGGLRFARTEIFNAANGDRSDVPDVIVLITDGEPNREVDTLDDEVRRIQNLGIRIVVLGVDTSVSAYSTTISFLTYS